MNLSEKRYTKATYIKFLDSTQSENASRVFLRGATFLLHIAAFELDFDFIVEHVLYGGVFCKMNDADEKNIKLLQDKINEYISEDENFTFTMVDIERAKELLLKEGMTQQVRLLKFRPFDYFRLYWYKEHCGYFHGIMPPSSGYLEGALLEGYEGGFMLKIPTPYKSDVEETEHQINCLNIFKTSEKLAEELNCSYIADLNVALPCGEYREYYQSRRTVP